MADDYITRKAKIMKHMGITNTRAIKALLKKETEGMNNVMAMEIRIDNICRSIIQNYFDGDRTYVVTKQKVNVH